MMRAVEQRKRQRNLEEAARVMAAHEQKIAALPSPPGLRKNDEFSASSTFHLLSSSGSMPPDLHAASSEAGGSGDPVFRAAPAALAETAEDIEAQIAALGLPPDFDPAPAPAAPDAFMETLLATAPLHLEVCGADMPGGPAENAPVAAPARGPHRQAPPSDNYDDDGCASDCETEQWYDCATWPA
jgi:hypothetical protein